MENTIAIASQPIAASSAYRLTLITPTPDRERLLKAKALVEDSWGLLNWLWLGEECCLDGDFETLPSPEAFKEWSHNTFKEESLDWALHCPNVFRQKRLLLADMDSTLIEEECIDELAKTFGVGEAIETLTLKAMQGELNFEEALNARLALLEGMPMAQVLSVLEKIKLMPGAQTLVATMKAFGAYTALVSGGFTLFSQPVKEKLGLDAHWANDLALNKEETALAGRVNGSILGKKAKAERLLTLCREKSLDLSEVLAVGDGSNDLGMITLANENAGMGVAYRAKPVVRQQASYCLNYSDLTGLLYLQGYPKTLWQTV